MQQSQPAAPPLLLTRYDAPQCLLHVAAFLSLRRAVGLCRWCFACLCTSHAATCYRFLGYCYCNTAAAAAAAAPAWSLFHMMHAPATAVPAHLRVPPFVQPRDLPPLAATTTSAPLPLAGLVLNTGLAKDPAGKSTTVCSAACFSARDILRKSSTAAACRRQTEHVQKAHHFTAEH